MTHTPDVPAERGRDELRERLAKATAVLHENTGMRSEFVDDAAVNDALAELRELAALLAPQEAREPEATAWREQHDRLLAVYVTAARSAFGGAEKWAAYMSAERALHAHIDMLAAARPAPETEREPTQAEIDDACMWYRHDFGLMSDEDAGRLRFTAREWLRAWHKAGARELLGAPAPAEATDTQGLDDARAAYFNARTCQCGEDARWHRCPTDEGRGFDPDWERVREMLERCQAEATERSEP